MTWLTEWRIVASFSDCLLVSGMAQANIFSKNGEWVPKSMVANCILPSAVAKRGSLTREKAMVYL
jgi:hypothetical protein